MDEAKEDRISSLPDCLLIKIISQIKIKIETYLNTSYGQERRMTTKEVIRATATISKRWQHLWTLLPNLTLYLNTSYGFNHTHYFSFINKTLTQCPIDVNLNKFKLYFRYSSTVTTTSLITSQFSSWIRYAITRNVQELNLESRDVTTNEELRYDDELFFNNSCITRMKLSNCVFNPPNGKIRWDKLKLLRISWGKLVGDSIGKILSGSPCLETLEMNDCYGFRRIEVTSKRFKNLVLTDYGTKYKHNIGDYIDTIEINAPYMLSLTINGGLSLNKLLLLNVSSLAKVDLDYRVNYNFATELGRDPYDIEEESLRGLLSSLGHVNQITIGASNCLRALSRLRVKGFQFFRVGADGVEDRSTVLTASGWEKIAETGESDEDMSFSLFD